MDCALLPVQGVKELLLERAAVSRDGTRTLSPLAVSNAPT